VAAPTILLSQARRPKIRARSGGNVVRWTILWIAICALAACGPFSVGGEPANDSSSVAPGTPPLDAGATDADAGSAAGGGDSAPQDGGGVPVTIVAHDLSVDGVSAGVVYAHKLKSKSVRYDRVVMMQESDLPEPGECDVHGGVVSADELHAHDIDAKWVDVGTLYVTKLETK
jgi:hypothetical protein